MMPAGPIRDDALRTLASKRAHIVGAALFWILPARRDRRLLRLLVTYEITLEFLDDANERAGSQANGRQLHRALVEALDPSAPISDYYRYHPWRDDGGYLRALVESCREGCLSLPYYADVQALVLREAERCRCAQSLNHESAGGGAAVALKDWAAREFPGEQETDWWELTAAASSSMGVHALLALAASRDSVGCAKVNGAYVPWICALSTMLDSYVDQSGDSADGQHSYLAHYPDVETAVARICELIGRSAYEARRLPNGYRHCLITAAMVAMYLSSEDARTPAMAANTASLINAGGSLTKVLVRVLGLGCIESSRRTAAERRRVGRRERGIESSAEGVGLQTTVLSGLVAMNSQN
jgi:tetraprenyl-beta-curcumene synthase